MDYCRQWFASTIKKIVTNDYMYVTYLGLGNACCTFLFYFLACKFLKQMLIYLKVGWCYPPDKSLSSGWYFQLRNPVDSIIHLVNNWGLDGTCTIEWLYLPSKVDSLFACANNLLLVISTCQFHIHESSLDKWEKNWKGDTKCKTG